MIEKLKACRICGDTNLIPVVNLGVQTIASIFSKSKDREILKAPLELVKCNNWECGLLQLNHTIDRELLYGQNYGYQSGINNTMRKHLSEIADYASDLVGLGEGDLVIDIGSNDGTLLKQYPKDIESIGVDPSAERFIKQYPPHSSLIFDYFDKEFIVERKAKIITSIAMLYDLPDPIEFMSDIKHCLEEDGIWVTEQAYMPTMIKNNSFDTICHEHLEYYGLFQIKAMAEKVGLDIIDVGLNEINGGSFMVTLAHPGTEYEVNYKAIDELLNAEMDEEYDTVKPYRAFQDNINYVRLQLSMIINRLNDDKKVVLGYGASTKGNVILQYCGLTNKEIPFIADRNPHKYNNFTPGMHIPIISEEDARNMKPDYFLVLPWHFKDEILEREKEFINRGGRFIFPLPTLTIQPSFGGDK